MRLLREYFLKNPPTGLREAFDQIIAAEHAAQGREPPLPRKQFSVDQETQSFQAEEHGSATGAPSECVTLRQPSLVFNLLVSFLFSLYSGYFLVLIVNFP